MTWRLIVITWVAGLILAACAGTSVTPSAVSISPSPSIKPSPSTPVGPAPVPPTEALVPTGDGPIALAASSASVWVELHREDRVARIDPNTNQQVEALDVPTHCALGASGDDVWTTIAKENLVTHFSASTGETLDTFQIDGACGIAVEGDTAWVESTAEGAVYVLQEGVAEPIQRIEVTPDPFDIVLDDTAAWVTSEAGGGTLWRIDRATYKGSLVGTFPGISFDSVEVVFGAVWLNARERDHIWKLDPSDGSVLAEADALAPSGVVAFGDSLWATLVDGGLVEFDPATLEQLSAQRLQYGSLGPPLYAFGSLWVSALENNTVLRVNVNAP
jgi:glutamine cyclotransferase